MAMKILIVVILTGLLLLMGCHYPEPQDAPQLLTTEVGELVQCGDFTIARERYMVNGVTLLRDSYFIHSYQGQSPETGFFNRIRYCVSQANGWHLSW